ncbi:hypothetical protein [Subtercola endophyticus]|uniref:hypothetical protein n=1 Tax=Subtercola endophyticus TaxID=2895559 RepID=UPI001E536745|nr:hypothetical protein [Subtercola endophyticus]UFS58700.1 hypothetical protein LQ955_17145 [Subtercola endophyticus]
MSDDKAGKRENAARQAADKAANKKAARQKAKREKAARAASKSASKNTAKSTSKKGASKRARRSYFPVDAPTVARAVEEGVLMSRTALTMATMNHIIIGAVRDKVDYDSAEVRRFVEAELHSLALEQAGLAEHMKNLQLEFPPMPKKSRTVADYQWLTQRRVTYSALSSELAQLQHDDAFLDEAVDASQKWAWSELSRAIEGQLDVTADLRSSPDYAAEREERMRELREVDLAALIAAAELDAAAGPLTITPEPKRKQGRMEP